MLACSRCTVSPRRGVTLVEMLVVVALVALMMVILVQIFQSATGAMTASRTIQELDGSLRRVDALLRQDLQGATARFTPPVDPKNNRGYFEYGENAFADAQGEDGDDYLAFTTRAPEGQYFTGRQWLAGAGVNPNVQPTTITSQVAEVIYFLRNGNLYRRTFLVVPERSGSMSAGLISPFTYFNTYAFGQSFPASWLGMNDISARPHVSGSNGNRPAVPTPNSLGHLTNRENRAFHPRFVDDFGRPGDAASPDGIPDDFNLDNIPDYYPTLYTDGSGYNQTVADSLGNPITIGWAPNIQVNECKTYNNGVINIPRVEQGTARSRDVYAFPFIYPGMYSVPVPSTVGSNVGWLHHLGSYFDHSPLEIGDNLLPSPVPNPFPGQTWFGFPTWRESMSGWTDPVISVVDNSTVRQQPPGLSPFNPGVIPPTNSLNFPPKVTISGTTTPAFGFDGAGSMQFANGLPIGAIWEDDLILTNVRSFDIKAYDAEAPGYFNPTNVPTNFLGAGYYDLGYASDTKFSNQTGSLNLTAGLNSNSYNNNLYLFQPLNREPSGFGHEGRIPSLPLDGRLDPRRKTLIGDAATGVIRLRRVFDTWSTDYTNAPDSDVDLNGRINNGTSTTNPPTIPNNTPIYPAFPAPYPSPLRGIQIQIRIGDARGERAKTLTIRQDFTDKL